MAIFHNYVAVYQRVLVYRDSQFVDDYDPPISWVV